MALMKMFLRQKVSQQHPMVTSLLSVNPIFFIISKNSNYYMVNYINIAL